MPLMWLRAHLATMPELQTEEALRASEVIAMGSGNLQKKDRDRVLRRWNKQAGQEGAARQVTTPNDLKAVKAAMGLL
jgi:hypothetical protein